MKKIALFGLFAFVLMPLMVLGQDAPVDPNQEFLSLLIQSIGGMKGMSTLAIVGVVVQLLLKLANTTWIKLDGSMKLLIVSGLGIVGGVIGLMIPPNSLSLGAALVHSTVLTALMVFLNQIYQKFLAPKVVA